MSTKKLDPSVLAQFTGSEHWYRHGLVRDILFTDGAKYVADAGGAWWLLDEIAIAQRFEKKVAAEEFQVWKLTVNPDRTAKLACEDGNDRTVFEKAIPFTDFPPRVSSSGSRTARSICRASIERGAPRSQQHHRCHKLPAGGTAPSGLCSGQVSRLIGPRNKRKRAAGAS